MLIFDQGPDLLTILVNTEVQIAEKDLNVVILDLIALILCASISLIRFLHDIIQLLVSLLDIPWLVAGGQVTIKEAKSRIFEAESDSNRAFCTSSIMHDRLYFRHSYIEDACLNLCFGDQKNVEPVLVSLSDKIVLGLTCMCVENDHNVILHES